MTLSSLGSCSQNQQVLVGWVRNLYWFVDSMIKPLLLNSIFIVAFGSFLGTASADPSDTGLVKSEVTAIPSAQSPSSENSAQVSVPKQAEPSSAPSSLASPSEPSGQSSPSAPSIQTERPDGPGSLLDDTHYPERVRQIKQAAELLRSPEKISAADQELDTILRLNQGFQFDQGPTSGSSKISKPAFEWIQNNLFQGPAVPFVGVFPVQDDGADLGYVVVKKELEKAPIFYLISHDGELKHLTRRL